MIFLPCQSNTFILKKSFFPSYSNAIKVNFEQSTSNSKYMLFPLK